MFVIFQGGSRHPAPPPLDPPMDILVNRGIVHLEQHNFTDSQWIVGLENDIPI